MSRSSDAAPRCSLCGCRESELRESEQETPDVPASSREERNRPSTSLLPFSRRLTKLLRHDAPCRGLVMHPDGFVSVSSVLSLNENRRFFLPDVFFVVSTDKKQRFQLAVQRTGSPLAVPRGPGSHRQYTEGGAPLTILAPGEVCCTNCMSDATEIYIRATQGHSVAEIESHRLLSPVRCRRELEEAVLAYTYPLQGPSLDSPHRRGVTLVHGTYLRSWEGIKQEGLKRMRRRHVHFTPFWGVWAGSLSDILIPSNDSELTRSEGHNVAPPVSGFKASCDLLLILNFEKALEKGLCFFVAANGVVLTEGDEQGAVPLDCFAAAVERQTGRVLT